MQQVGERSDGLPSGQDLGQGNRRPQPSPPEDICEQGIADVDGTARPQIVDRETNPSMFGILTEYKARRGFSVMVNTSFNMHEEPIIRTPEEAVESVKQAELDVLAIGRFIATRA